MLCGKKSCPLLARIRAYLKIKPLYDREMLEGASPPSVFVGRIGYPHVYAGPLVPPEQGDTSLLDIPEFWFGKSIEEIVDMRFNLVRGKYRVNVNKPKNGGRILDDTRLIGLSEKSVEVDLSFKSKPNSSFSLNADVQPMGPSAMIENFKIEGNVKAERYLEKAYYDTDLKAADAVLDLYNNNVRLSSIQRAFSVGSFGLKGQRKLVPTRWSITAVDSMLSIEYMKDIKQFPAIDGFRVYESNYLDNLFQIIMLPEGWKYECIEAWYPGTIWNPFDQNIHMYGDWENYQGRTTYARIGGCYYAARLAVNDLLKNERRQAGVIVLREIRSGYIMPVGVWNVRENVRNALRQKPIKFAAFNEVLDHISERFNIGLNVWIKNSKLISDTLEQKKITDFFDFN
ncbi:MAG: hypothetical protein FK730_01665 [Asgard group archaeon]|nr:hypothetical protein [Asgard group archaeon]